MPPPSLNDIKEAAERIRNYVHKTPVLSSASLNAQTEAELWFKCENFQKTGSFKARGACNAVLQIPPVLVAKGVCTHSSGNHGQALAYVAHICNVPAHVVVPENAPEEKVSAIRRFKASITYCDPGLEAREAMLRHIRTATGSTFIHPYDNTDVIAGQGTAALELHEDVPGLDMIVTPVGGGGLLSGTSLATKQIDAAIQVIGAEPALADDAARSLKDGIRYPPVSNSGTVADGLLTCLGEINWPIIQRNVDDIITTDEDSILLAMHIILQKLKIVIEPSSAVALAIILRNPDRFKGKRVGVILTGGNVQLNVPYVPPF